MIDVVAMIEPFTAVEATAPPARFAVAIHCADLLHTEETIMKKWLIPEIAEAEAGMEVTSYLPAELDRA